MTSPADARVPLRPRRRIAGHAAMLLPHTHTGEVDWTSFEELLARTVAAGLKPAVNMDTGFVQLVDPATRAQALEVTLRIVGPSFLAGAYVADRPGDAFNPDAYTAAMDAIAAHGGVPVVFPSHGLNALDPAAWVDAHKRFAERTDRFIAFELGPMFVPYGRIYPLETYRELLGIAGCVGAKHSSLSRQAEWDRLALRDTIRPDFAVLTGNDLAIDMVCYGSDYLLGLAAFAPDLFARRDRALGGGRRRLRGAERRAAAPRHVRLPRPGPRVPPRRGDVAPAAGLDRRRRRGARRPGTAGGGSGRPSRAGRRARAARMSPLVQVRRLADVEAFTRHCTTVGVDLPIDPVVEAGGPLTAPLVIRDGSAGERVVGNHLAVLPMEGWDGTTDGAPTDLVRRRWRRFGLSGAKLIWGGEAVAVDPAGRANPHQLVLEPRTAAPFAAPARRPGRRAPRRPRPYR